MTPARRLDFPAWLQKRAVVWIDRLGLGDWTISFHLQPVVEGDAENRAITYQYPDINQAQIIVRADVEDTEAWEITLVHELLHVLHARVDSLVEDLMIQDHPQSALLSRAYRSVYEPYTDRLAKRLVALVKEGEK